jgi:uncharacterized protein YdiU (UPF0061 family)
MKKVILKFQFNKKGGLKLTQASRLFQCCRVSFTVISPGQFSIGSNIPEQINASYKTHLHQWIENYSRRIQKDNTSNADRQLQMNKINPKYVIRNYLAQLAIDQAELGDFSMIEELLTLFRKPYDEQPSKEKFAAKRPDWARQRAGCSMLSCSS